MLLAAIAAAVVVLPFGANLLGAHRFGLIWQGRYELPVAVGLPILAAFALQAAVGPRCSEGRPRDDAGPPAVAALALGGMCCWAFAQVASVLGDLRRYAVGSGPWTALAHPVWRPPVPVPVVAAMAVAGAGAVVLLGARCTRQQGPPPGRDGLGSQDIESSRRSMSPSEVTGFTMQKRATTSPSMVVGVTSPVPSSSRRFDQA